MCCSIVVIPIKLCSHVHCQYSSFILCVVFLFGLLLSISTRARMYTPIHYMQFGKLVAAQISQIH